MKLRFAGLGAVVATIGLVALFTGSALAQTPGTGGMMGPGGQAGGNGTGMAPGSGGSGNVTGHRFMMGFGTMASMMGNVVGQPLQDEWHSANGDGIQMTTTGMMVWRKADNWTAFTNGYMTWVNGPYGIQQRLNTQRFPWEAQ